MDFEEHRLHRKALGVAFKPTPMKAYLGALNNGISGSLEGPSSYLMKSPPRQIQDDDAAELVEEFIERNRRDVTAPAPAQI